MMSVLQCALEADHAGLESIAYEFMTQAFVLYESDVSESKLQMDLIATFVGTLSAMKSISEDNYDTLITKTTQYSAKLLKKPDQCRCICKCSRLFWNDSLKYYQNTRVFECLQKSLRIADVCMQVVALVW